MNHVYNPNWGAKRTCLSCNAKFYDLARLPIHCPKCQTEFVDIPRPKPLPRGPAKMHWGRVAGGAAKAASVVVEVSYPITNAAATEDKGERDEEDDEDEPSEEPDDEADEGQ